MLMGILSVSDKHSNEHMNAHKKTESKEMLIVRK